MWYKKIIEKKGREKIVMVTAYDYQTAKILDECNIDLILVGDSLGMVFQGHKDTKSVRLEHMIYHTECVARGVKNTPVLSDMPVNTHNTVDEAIRNAEKLIEAGAAGVLIEGYKPHIVREVVSVGIPVISHLGILPQTEDIIKVKGKTPEERKMLIDNALDMEEAGIFALALELVVEDVAREITNKLRVPTIGVGAGRYCDGQVLVINDLLGYDYDFSPKFLKRYADLRSVIKKAVIKFRDEVRRGLYPSEEYVYK